MNASSGFQQAVMAEQKALRRFAMHLARGNASNADDAVQEALLKALSHEHQFQPDTQLRAWLFTILRNTYIQQHRRRWKYEADLADASAVVDLIPAAGINYEARSDLARVRTYIATLSPSNRMLMRLVEDGDAYDVIAAKTGLNIGTVKSRINRLRAQLEAVLADPRAHSLGAHLLCETEGVSA